MEEYELAIIGGGPTGLFSTFCAGLRDIKSVTLEALSEASGQILKFYPVKDVLDVPGIPSIKGMDLSKALITQAKLFGAEITLNSKVTDVRKDGENFLIEVNGESKYKSKAVLICTGIGSLRPTKINVPGEDIYEEKGVYYSVIDREAFSGKTVAVIGGGDAGFDWANQIIDSCKKIYIVEYMQNVKAMERSVNDLLKTGKAEILTSFEVKEIIGDGSKVSSLKIAGVKTGEVKNLAVDSVIVAIGHKTEPYSLKSLDIELVNKKIKVDENMSTNVPGIYAAGDCAVFSSRPKMGLLAVCFSDAYMAVNNIKRYLNPASSVFGEHSTNLKLG